jgi:uncharacterized protein YgiM (DUF1202 family)
MSKCFLSVIALFLVGCANISPMTDPASPPTNIPIDIPTDIPTQAQISMSAPPSEVTVGVVQVDVLNIREGPGTSFPAMGALNRGEKFYVLGEYLNETNNKWLLISRPDDSFAWVAGDQTHVTLQKEVVDHDIYLTWLKNVDEAKAVLTSFTATAIP